MIKIINSYFKSEDERGKFIGIINNNKWEEINFIHSKEDSVRGGHFHKKTDELFFIISGKIEITFQEVKNKTEFGQQRKIIVSKNDIFIINKNIYHEFRIVEEATWINALSKKHDVNNPDFHNKIKHKFKT